MKTASENSRLPIRLVHNGAGRGGRYRQQQLADFNRRSRTIRLDPIWVDPDPGKARGLVEDGTSIGLKGSFAETTGEEYLAGLDSDSRTVVVTAIDDAAATGRIIRLAEENPHFVYSIVDLPEYGVTGWAFALPPKDKVGKQAAQTVYNALDGLTARGGTRDVFGPPGASVNRFLEQRFRAYFARHFEHNIGKALHGLEPEASPAEVTFDGKTTSQVVVLEPGIEWRSAAQLLDELKSSLTVPVRPGKDFTIVELGNEAMRIHKARYRVSDRRFALDGPGPGATSNPKSEVSTPGRPQSVLSKLNAAILAD